MCARAQVNTSSMALGLLAGGTFAEPYATLPKMQAQSLFVLRTIADVSFSLRTSRWIELQRCRPGSQRVRLVVVAAVMVVAIAVVLARVGSDASSRRGCGSAAARDLESVGVQDSGRSESAREGRC